jgi:integrase
MSNELEPRRRGKRGQNEGTVYQTATGHWRAEVKLPNGKRKYFQAPTQRAALGKRKDFELQRSLGLESLDGEQSVKTFLERWLADVQKPAVRTSTFESYGQVLRKWVYPRIGSLKLAKVTGQHLQALYSELSKENYSPASVVRIHSILHKAFKQALMWRILLRNPADEVTRPRIPRQEMRTLSFDGLQALRDAAPSQLWRSLFVLAGTHGLRRGEALSLRWKDIDLDAATLSIVRTLHHPQGGGYEFAEPKTKSGKRKIRLADHVVAELKLQRTEQLAHRLATGPAWDDEDLVFANAFGRPLGEDKVTENFHRALERAELPRIRFHDLRHTAATVMMGLGVHPKMVQETLGHSNIAITLDIYSHVTPDMQRDAVDRLNVRYAP